MCCGSLKETGRKSDVSFVAQNNKNFIPPGSSDRSTGLSLNNADKPTFYYSIPMKVPVQFLHCNYFNLGTCITSQN